MGVVGTATGRDSKGRWLPGVKPANANLDKVAALRKALVDAVGTDRFAAMTEKICDLVFSDNPYVAIAAYELLCNRLLGKPKESIEITDTANRSEEEIRQALIARGIVLNTPPAIVVQDTITHQLPADTIISTPKEVQVLPSGCQAS